MKYSVKTNTPVTLKYGQGYWKWYEQVKHNEWYHYVEFDSYYIYSVQENHNIKNCHAGPSPSPTLITT